MSRHLVAKFNVDGEFTYSEGQAVFYTAKFEAIATTRMNYSSAYGAAEFIKPGDLEMVETPMWNLYDKEGEEIPTSYVVGAVMIAIEKRIEEHATAIARRIQESLTQADYEDYGEG